MQMDKPLNEAEWHAVAPLFPDLISKHDLEDLLTIMENGRLSPLLTSREQENLDNLIEGFRIILDKMGRNNFGRLKFLLAKNVL